MASIGPHPEPCLIQAESRFACSLEQSSPLPSSCWPAVKAVSRHRPRGEDGWGQVPGGRPARWPRGGRSPGATLPIEGTSVTLRMVPVEDADGRGYYTSATEVTWDLYDAFIFNLDTDAGKSTPESSASPARASPTSWWIAATATPGSPP